jgi:hypothetical protein
MKKMFLFLLLFLLLFLSFPSFWRYAQIIFSDTTVPAIDQVTIEKDAQNMLNQLVTNPLQMNQNVGDISSESSDLNIYNKWKLLQNIIDRNDFYFNESEKNDCIKLENGDTGGGDLLSTLIIDHDARNQMKLKVYTPEYVLKLENAIVGVTHKKYDADFYAFSTCHLSNNIDVIAGILWPIGKSVVQTEGKFAGDIDPYFGEKKVLAIVKNFSPIFFEDVETLNNTATGAEILPCDASLAQDNQNVIWSCFIGLHHTTDDDGVDGSNMTEWTLPINGGTPIQRDYIEYLSF